MLFSFPRTIVDDKPAFELWASSAILKPASPYFKTLLESEFEEGTPVSKRRRLTTPEAKGWEDSDDERDRLKATKRAAAVDASTTTSTTSVSLTGTKFHHVIVIDTAYLTYEAVLGWLTTGRIKLTAKPESDDNWGRIAPRVTGPSPRSVYRLAHLLDLKELCFLALEAIEAQLTSASVAKLLFSEFCVEYEEVQQVLYKWAAAHWIAVQASAQWQAAKKRLDGDSGEYVPIFIGLLDTVNARSFSSSAQY